MSTTTGLENAGRMSLVWTVAVVGTGLMMVGLIIGLLLQRGGDVEAPHATVDEASVPEATADYGIRHLGKSDARSLEATTDYGIRHAEQPAPLLAPETDYGIRHSHVVPRITPEADYGIRHPQRVVRPFAPEDDYGVRNRKALGR